MTLKELRESKGLTLTQAADILGVSKGYLSMVENGKRTRKLEFLFRLADLYGVSDNKIFKCATKGL